MVWVCSACTFNNADDDWLSCMMCHTVRRSSQSSQSSPASSPAAGPSGGPKDGSPPSAHGGEREDREAPAAVAAAAEGKQAKLNFGGRREEPCRDPHDHGARKRQPREELEDEHGDEPSGDGAGYEQDSAQCHAKGTDNDAHQNFDAFKSLEDNYQSSSSDSEVDDDGEDEEELDDGAQKFAFSRSFEQNYQSSSSSSDSECDEDDEDEYPELDDRKPAAAQKPSVECVELLDSDSDSEESCLEVVPTEKENNRRDATRRRRSMPTRRHSEPLEVDDDDESDLSEVESRRPLPSPASRPIPPWQRASTSASKPSRGADSFACMQGRNDLSGGGIAEGGGGGERRTGSGPAKKRPRRSRKAGGGASSAAPSAKPRRRKRAPAAAGAGGGKKRRKRGASRSTGRQGSDQYDNGGGPSSYDSAWAPRERGVRQPRGGRGRGRGRGRSRSRSAPPRPYMNISEAEPALNGIGGATFQF